MINSLLLLFIGSLVIQAVYFIWFDRSWKKQLEECEDDCQPVSVIVAAHNEGHRIEKLLKKLENQEYPDFEIIVVNDRSTDNTSEVLKKFGKVKVVEVKQTPAGWDHKKFAVNEGVLASKNEWLLFTDADCLPVSNEWVKSMAKSLHCNDVVLGVSPFYKSKTLLGEFIQYEFLLTAWQYVSYALNKMPYMGVGRNLAYRKSVFLQNEGFTKIKNHVGGDDDLLINQWGVSASYHVNLEKESFTYTSGKNSWNGYFKQKIRHLSAGKKYKLKDKWRLGGFILSLWVFWVVGVILFLTFNQPLIILLAIIARLMFMLPTVWVAKEKLSSKFKIRNLVLLDVSYSFYYLITSIAVLTVKRIKWK